MNRRKLIRKLAVSAVIIFVSSIVILLLQFPYRNWQYKKHRKKSDQYITALTNKYQNYLTEIAQKITSIAVDQRIISEFQSEYLLNRQQIRQVKKYLWMSNNKGEFMFGVPSEVFTKLNSAFDKYREVIKNDGHYLDRNDFFLKLVDKHYEIDFSEFERREPPKHGIFKMVGYKWRFYELKSGWDYFRPTATILSSPVTDNDGKVIGALYLKIDDWINHEKYFSKHGLNENDLFSVFIPMFKTLTFLSGLFLWFLLPTWVYIDAQQRDVKNPGVWAFLTLISLFFGLTIYLITRPSTLKSFHCPQCEHELNGTKAFCPYCGFDLSSTFCQQCQYPIKPDWMYCPNCRAELKQKPQPETVVEKENGDNMVEQEHIE